MIDDPVASMTIVDTAVSAGNFTSLVVARQATGLDATLSDTSQKLTVLAPTDEAFALIGQETIDSLLMDTTKLSDILTYHVVSGEVPVNTAISLAGTKCRWLMVTKLVCHCLVIVYSLIQ